MHILTKKWMTFGNQFIPNANLFIRFKLIEQFPVYRKKLEQAYRLCPRCERHLKRTLNNVKKNILGSKLAQLGAKGLHAFDLHFSTAKSDNKIQQRRQLFAKICLLAMIVISALTAYQTTAAIDINKKKLDAVLRPSATAAILIAASYISACKIIATRFIDYLVSLPYVTTAFGVWRLMVAYLCTVFGQTIWSSVQTTFLTEINNFSDGMNATTGEDQTIIANVAGCLLSIFVIFAAGLRFSTAFSLLLWTVHFLLATQIGSGVTPVLAVAVDAISVSFAKHYSSTIILFLIYFAFLFSAYCDLVVVVCLDLEFCTIAVCPGLHCKIAK